MVEAVFLQGVKDRDPHFRFFLNFLLLWPVCHPIIFLFIANTKLFLRFYSY